MGTYYGIDAQFDTVDDLLNAVVPDIVSIILPTQRNPPAVVSCCKAGVRVLSCEKPISISLREDVAGYNSLMPKYGAPSFEEHLRQSYITEPGHEAALKNREY